MLLNTKRPWTRWFGGVLVCLSASAATGETEPVSRPDQVMMSPCREHFQGDFDAALECTNASLEEADTELNRVYQEVLASIDPAWHLAEDYAAVLRTSQRAWIAFRDADCDRIALAARDDVNLATTACHEYHTRQRIKELQSY